MTPNEFKAACDRAGLSIYAARKVLGISMSQAYRYSTGRAEIPIPIARLVTMLDQHGVPEGWRE